jgi:hypothetical protein
VSRRRERGRVNRIDYKERSVRGVLSTEEEITYRADKVVEKDGK